MGIAEEIERLEDLRAAGSLSDEEFAAAKRRVLEGEPTGSYDSPVTTSSSGIKDWMQPKEWCMVLHLSQFCGYLIPLAGLVAPILIWQILKEDIPQIDAHGKMVVNWMISMVIYAIIGIALCFVVVGIFVLIALGIISIVFPIIGAVKASEGVVWEYPLTIRFVQ